MRLLGLQEDSHGTDLGLDRLSDVVDKHMMASTGNMELSDDNLSEEGSMISNLPLLFADGYPTSLEEITLPQLERFITFMVQCSFGHDTAKVVGQPQWWPKEVAFSNPFIRPKKVNENWIGNLKKLVFRCYTYHRSEYLLRFCSYLALYPRDKLQYVNNWDSTTSLYHKGTGKLLVTFRNENMNYDKKVESPRRSLLPRNIAPPGSSCKTKQQQQQQQQQQEQQQQQCHQVMVHPPCDDIYLCDSCDAEFVGLQKMQEHEKTCCDQERTGANSRPETPDPALQLPQTTQNQFLEYFHLCSRDSSCKPNASSEITIAGNATTTNVDGVTSRTSRRIRGSVNLTRCPAIPFSSPAGIFMVKKSKTMTEVTQQERLERIERHLCAPPLCAGSRPRWLDRTNEYNRWIVTYKPNRDKPNKNYVHEYKFNNLKEKPVLSIRSQLLYMACRPMRVLLTRLTDKDIVELKRDISKYQCPSRKRPPRARPRSASMSHQDANKNTLKRKLSVDHNSECSTPGPSSSKYRKALSTPTGRRSAVRLEVNVGTLGPTTLPMTKSVSTTKTPDCIPLINLCSSDEEDEGLCPRVMPDENREPERGSPDTAIIASSNFLDDITQSRCCASPNTLCVDWLTNRKMIDHHEDHLNNVNDSDDNCGKKCISETVLKTCSLYPPMLKQTP